MARNRNIQPDTYRDRTRTPEARRVSIERRNIRRDKYAGTLDMPGIPRVH